MSFWPIFRHVFLTGFLVVFGVNYVSYFCYPWILSRLETGMVPAQTVLIALLDVAVRIGLYFVFSAIAYSLLAKYFGFFGGDIMTAFYSVFSSLLHSISLGNLPGVYFYAAILGAFPIYTLAVAHVFLSKGKTGDAVRYIFFLLPLSSKPILSATVMVGVLIVVSVFFSVSVAITLVCNTDPCAPSSQEIRGVCSQE